MRTRVKICGITRIEDGLAAARAGADAIGLVFYPNSSRFVETEMAASIARAMPPFISKVALFVNAPADEISAVLQQVPIDLIQFHGNECPEYCAGQGRPYIKAIRMKEGIDLLAEREKYDTACGLLVDSYVPGIPGGTGETFNWSLIPREIAGEIVLAGGLGPRNVHEAVTTVRPWGVDVSGGVEISGGIKDATAIQQFVTGVQHGDRNNH
ncbi:MAG: phosphoribosylanthranilate isomerase [Chromatiales bacterium]|jgi:phosphoribosylanthranilate isomerase